MVNLLEEIDKGRLVMPVSLKVDNEGCRMLMDGDGDSKRAKHIDIRCFFIRDFIKKKVLKLVHVPTTYQMADIFTKLLPGPRTKFLSMYILGMRRESPEALK